tara:strand:+ start:253 stop:561 length:309 start_codon:yes stop_codon:yes gene_type:complete
MVRIESINDVYNELINCYDEIQNFSETGEILYMEHFFFANTSELLDKKTQEDIKVYNYCKAFNCPPYPSIQETPAKELENFLLIDSEVNKYYKSKKEGSNGN